MTHESALAEDLTRRAAAARLIQLFTTVCVAGVAAGCGGGGDASPGSPSSPASTPPPAPTPPAPTPPAPTPPAPPPPPAPAPSTTPVERLKAALQTQALTVRTQPLTVSEGSINSVISSFGADAQIYPPLQSNPSGQTLADITQVWGFRRDLWLAQAGAAVNGTVVYPMQRNHPSSLLQFNTSVCPLHFTNDGQAFEILAAGTDMSFVVIVDGQYAAPAIIQTAISDGTDGAPLTVFNTFVHFDFGSAAPRKISVYAVSSQGPCAIAFAAGDHPQGWDRSAEPSFAVMCDSYGGAFGPNWGVSGPFWEAAAQLGIPSIDRDAIGGTGYAPNNTNDYTRDPGNAFGARLPSNVNALPDLFLTAGGINDNNSMPAPPLYATGDDAKTAFNSAVSNYYAELRKALPDSVLASLGPWRPRQSIPTDPIDQLKADTIKAALVAVGGPWVFLDNLNGGWVNSAGAIAPPDGAWQTGTGTTAAPAGDGNGDLYLVADGTHPNVAGCLYLGTRIATALRAAVLAL